MNDQAASFEAGVADYFQRFGHRLAREAPHQAWLLISLAKWIDPQLLVGELTVPNQDLSPFATIDASSGALNFDFAVTRSEIDLRTWKKRTPGWRAGRPTEPQTLQTLREVEVLAELKVADSTSTSRRSIEVDLRKLQAAIGFLKHHDCEQLPACYMVVLDPQRRIDTQQAIDLVAPTWPEGVSLPKILVGP